MPSNLEYDEHIALWGVGDENGPKLDSKFLQDHSKIVMEKTKLCAICHGDIPIDEEVYSLYCGWN